MALRNCFYWAPSLKSAGGLCSQVLAGTFSESVESDWIQVEESVHSLGNKVKVGIEDRVL